MMRRSQLPSYTLDPLLISGPGVPSPDQWPIEPCSAPSSSQCSTLLSRHRSSGAVSAEDLLPSAWYAENDPATALRGLLGCPGGQSRGRAINTAAASTLFVSAGGDLNDCVLADLKTCLWYPCVVVFAPFSPGTRLPALGKRDQLGSTSSRITQFQARFRENRGREGRHRPIVSRAQAKFARNLHYLADLAKLSRNDHLSERFLTKRVLGCQCHRCFLCLRTGPNMLGAVVRVGHMQLRGHFALPSSCPLSDVLGHLARATS